VRAQRPGTGRNHLLAGVEDSLRRLGTDYIDLYQVHAWDPATPLEETLATLDSLVKSGKVRYIGASNFTGWQLQKALDLSRLHGWERFATLPAPLQPARPLHRMGADRGGPARGAWRHPVEPAARRLAQRLHPARRHRPAERHPGGNRRAPRLGRVLERLPGRAHLAGARRAVDVAERTGRTPAQVAIAWLGGRPTVTAPIIGVRTLDQLTDVLGAADTDLTPGDTELLTTASELPLPYPYNVIATDPLNR